ncbi:MAG: exo-alpha-sialidase [Deltaproteobacteria bacterium]|uniref:Exo-alpha-sialidase n=1 Tax=Candidatus Zymogenus saltonus TaxID=2844893 RepID=A0A9D8KG77_9DELT|nr:exo-alpha-sialidase [Candidatus Zymogenus saltonus]
MKVVKYFLAGLGIIFLLPVLLISVMLIYWDLRSPPPFEIDPVLKLENRVAVPHGDDPRTLHKSNTDMVFYNGSFFLIHARTKWHLEDKNGALIVQRSNDAVNWEEVASITVPDTDVRDPKFAAIDGRLFVYFLPNFLFDPEPMTTYWTVSDDGVNWETPKELDTIAVVDRRGDSTAGKVTSGGWNLWRPKTKDGKNWYVMASGNKKRAEVGVGYGGKIEGDDVEDEGTTHMIVLLRSSDGVNWEEVSEVYVARGLFEPCMEFLPDGRIISAIRCSSLGTGGYAFGNPTANTIIAVSSEPYKEWKYSYSFITRLDGATLFPVNGRIFAVGRNHMGPRFDMGNHLATKRTAFYEVKEKELVFLFDLPSNGDTSYTGVVRRGDYIYASYYTCPVDKDYPWVVGVCFFPKTEIRVVKLSAKGLLEYADRVGASGGR